MSFAAMAFASSRAASKCAGVVPALAPQYTQILLRAVPFWTWSFAPPTSCDVVPDVILKCDEIRKRNEAGNFVVEVAQKVKSWVPEP